MSISIKNKETLGRKGQIVDRTRITYKCENCGKKQETFYGNIKRKKKKYKGKIFCEKCCTRKSRLINIKGQKFGRLLVIDRVDGEKRKRGYWICKCDCGNIINVYGTSLRQRTTKSCGCLNIDKLKERKGKNHPFWKGGRNKIDGGYILIYKPDHPRRPSNKYVLEHIVVMENHLGRYLLENESVHHKNGIKHDNRIENLELRTRNHGQGQGVDDMIKFCAEYLKKYAPEYLK